MKAKDHFLNNILEYIQKLSTEFKTQIYEPIQKAFDDDFITTEEANKVLSYSPLTFNPDQYERYTEKLRRVKAAEKLKLSNIGNQLNKRGE